MSIRSQITFSGEANCLEFRPNRFKADFCECSNKIDKHSSAAITRDEDIVNAIQFSQKGQKEGSCIIPISEAKDGGLYLGGYLSATNEAFLSANRIKLIINAALGLDKMFPKFGEAMKEISTRMAVIQLPWVDEPSFVLPLDDIMKGIRSIDEARSTGSSVLVHCAQGKSRSTSLVVAYIMWKNKVDPLQALQLVQQHRPLAEPNPGFMSQLKAYHSSGAFT